MPPTTHIEIKGQKELERAFLEMRKDVLVGLKPAILELSEVVRAEAQNRARAEIANIGPRWQQMRIGVTVRGAYVAPRFRRRGGSPRPNLAGELLDSMQGALEAKAPLVERRFDELITASAATNGFY